MSVLSLLPSPHTQAAIVNPTTGFIAVYDPLVIDQGTQPATNPATGAPLNPAVPAIPAGSVVGIWFGFNSNTLALQRANGETTLQQNHCVSGIPVSPFTQFSYCNAGKFFQVANTAIGAGTEKDFHVLARLGIVVAFYKIDV